MIKIAFEVHAITYFGQGLRLVGNIEQLGEWAPALGLDLHTKEGLYPKWRTTSEISVPDGVEIEFKLVKMKNGFEVERWEHLDANRVYTTCISKEQVLLRFSENWPGVEEIYTGSIEKSSQLVLENYTKILSKFKIQSYPLVSRDVENFNLISNSDETLKVLNHANGLPQENPLEHLLEEKLHVNTIEKISQFSESLFATKQATNKIDNETEEEEELICDCEEGDCGYLKNEQSLDERPNRHDETEEVDKCDCEEGDCDNHDYEQSLDEAPSRPYKVDYENSNGCIGLYYRNELKEKSSLLTSLSVQKAQRLKNELKQLSKCLPVQSSNSIFVLYDETRLDVMRVLIFGSEGTPYAHGAYIFDIFIPDVYPQEPPKVAIVSTKGERIRFNPNLYAEGLVCLSLLGTWEGNPSESWDPTKSNIYQVLLSIQSLVMNEDVYYNEPFYEDTKGTQQGEESNRAYSNVVRYFNVSHAMCDMLERPPPEFKAIIEMHFKLKRDVIKATLEQWIALAQKKESCNYQGLVFDHNEDIAKQYEADPAKYTADLVAEAKRLNILLDALANKIIS